MTVTACALADQCCDGHLIVRTTAAGETVYLCAKHEAAHAFAWTGVLPALRMLATERDRRTA